MRANVRKKITILRMKSSSSLSAIFETTNLTDVASNTRNEWKCTSGIAYWNWNQISDDEYGYLFPETLSTHITKHLTISRASTTMNKQKLDHWGESRMKSMIYRRDVIRIEKISKVMKSMRNGTNSLWRAIFLRIVLHPGLVQLPGNRFSINEFRVIRSSTN